MFDFFRKHTRVLQFLLVLLIFPSFVFFGIQGYSKFTDGDNASVAKVDGHKITQGEWDSAHKSQVERFRAQMPGIDVAMFDTPAMKQASLDELVRERVLLAAVGDLHIVVGDARLKRLFTSDEQFAFLRNPDGSVNKSLLAAQGMSLETFDARLRQEMAKQQLLSLFTGTAVAPAAVVAAALDPMFQQREVQLQRFEPKDYTTKVSPTQADLEAYYKANAGQFQSPEHATVEYLVLDIDAVKKTVNPPEADLRKFYEQNAARYGTPEQRRVSHILVKVDKDASADARAKAKARAEALLEQVRKSPASFADVARKNSEDPGSAERGGDLDFINRGDTIKAFEDAAFSLKQGEISGLVATEEGFHIIQVNGIRGGDKRSFESVRAEIEDEVRRQLAQQKFAELAIDFSNTVYEQADGLKFAAERFKLAIQTAQNVGRAPAPGATGPLANPKVLNALFSAESIRTKRNTEAVEIAANQLVSARLVQYTPTRALPLAEVTDRVRERVVAQQAAALARKEGEARLASAKASPQTAWPGEPQKVSRLQARELPRPVVDAVLRAPAQSLPAVVGVDLGEQGYVVARVTRVIGRDPEAGDPAKASAQYAQLWADAESRAYLEALKHRYKAQVTAKPPAAAASEPPAR